MQSESAVAIFWDYENCHASSQISGLRSPEIAKQNRLLFFSQVMNSRVPSEMLPTGMDPSSTLKRTWRFLDQQAIPSDLSAFAPNSSPPESGVSLTDCPHNGRKGVADQMILVDMLSYARDHPTPATIFLISGDRDFAYAVSVLQMRNYEVVVLSLAAHISLRNQASAWIDWRTHVLAYCTSGSAETPTAADVGSTPSPPRMASYFGDRECAATPGSAKSSPESPASTNAPSLERLRERPTVVSIPAPAYSAPELPNPTSRGRVEESGRVSPAPSVPSLASPILLASPVRNPGASQSPPGGQKPPTAPKRKVPAIFQPLVDVLEKHHAKGVPRPLRSAVGYELVGLANTVYKEAGVKSFSQFTALAVKEKIVEMGGEDGKAWIALVKALVQ